MNNGNKYYYEVNQRKVHKIIKIMSDLNSTTEPLIMFTEHPIQGCLGVNLTRKIKNFEYIFTNSEVYTILKYKPSIT